MERRKPATIDRATALRYMGASGWTPDTATAALLDKAEQTELTDIALATAADALASVLLEQVCDELENEIRAQIEAQGVFMTGRYAPGYGDCPLELNDALCLAADTVRGCGLAVTPQHLLTPRKSTTAILGIADHPVTGTRAGCATCHLKETCSFRKRGTTCFTQD